MRAGDTNRKCTFDSHNFEFSDLIHANLLQSPQAALPVAHSVSTRLWLLCSFESAG